MRPPLHSPTAATALVGASLDGYRIDRLLGKGATSEVFAARSPDGQAVAIKVSKAEIMDESVSAKRFLREAQAMKRLEHPGAVEVLGWGVSQGRGYIVMELVQGESLDHVLSRRVLIREHAIEVGMALLDVLVAAHATGVVHRDIKPANIMLTHKEDGTPLVKLLDFGVAKLLRQDGDEDATKQEPLTKPGAMFGTPNYMAPETLRRKHVKASADLYAVGVVMYVMLSGRLPIEASDAVAVLIKVATKPPTPLREHLPDIDVALEQLVMKALEKKPENRFPDAQSMLDALAELMPEDTIPRGRATPRQPSTGDTKRRTTALGTLIHDAGGASRFMAERDQALAQLRSAADDDATLFMTDRNTVTKDGPPRATGAPTLVLANNDEDAATLFMMSAPSSEEARAARLARHAVAMDDDDETLPSVDAPMPEALTRVAAHRGPHDDALDWPPSSELPPALMKPQGNAATPILIGVAVALLAGAAVLVALFL